MKKHYLRNSSVELHVLYVCRQLDRGCIGVCRANLSELYFTQRQDRYVMLSNCPSLADFFDQLIACVQRYSFHLQPDDSVQLASGVTCHPFAGNKVLDCSLNLK